MNVQSVKRMCRSGAWFAIVFAERCVLCYTCNKAYAGFQRVTSFLQEFARFGVQSLALFGSVARGEDQPESDVDILVEFEGRATFDRYMELVNRPCQRDATSEVCQASEAYPFQCKSSAGYDDRRYLLVSSSHPVAPYIHARH
jgi:hypothetical protein